MVPVLVSIGPVTLYSFGAMMALGFLLSGYVVSFQLARRRLDPEIAWSIVMWGAVGGIVGSRVLALASEWREFLANPLSAIFSGSGFVWYGGLIGGFVSVSILLARRRVPWLVAVDCIAPGLALGQAIGRIGCQISGDGDWGHATSLWWGVAYPDAIVGWASWLRENGLPLDTRVHPAPVYETLAYSAIFLVLWNARGRGLRDGSLLWLYLALSSVARFAVEAVRVEPVLGMGLTQAQWIAIPLGVIGLALFLRPPGRPAETGQ